LLGRIFSPFVWDLNGDEQFEEIDSSGEAPTPREQAVFISVQDIENVDAIFLGGSFS
jgi:hypothetical protein